ncbi:unnamed protein product [Effrenium voratum]|uniref:Uncharacterized protein n=1 Tax=Effrenium voratum TaxID=2562239 RepID=A0AA36JHL1_9DINO|nr:unnamed protein product [Effrenium voratum]
MLAQRDDFFESWLQVLEAIWRSANMPLLLLDSSPWPFRMTNISAILAEAEPRLSERPASPGQWASRSSTRAWVPMPKVPKAIRVWSLGLHATLAMEPESIWKLLSAGSWEISVEMVLARNYCNLGEMGRCTQNAAFAELLTKHVIPRAPALNKLNKFPHVAEADQLEREFRAIAEVDEGVRKADVLMCSEPPFFCQMFLGMGKTIFGYIGNPFGAYLLPGQPQEEFYQAFQTKLAVGMNSFACMSPYLAALIYWHSGIHVPVVRPLGLYTAASYMPSPLAKILVTKSIFVATDMALVLNDFVQALQELEEKARVPLKHFQSNATRFVRLEHLSDRSWANWARHRAAVFLPYDPQQMVFYELYSMAIPMLVPDDSLLPFFIRFGYTNLQEFRYQRPGWHVPPEELPDWGENAMPRELRWWSSLTDFALSPHLLRWRSIPELLWQVLRGADLEKISSGMRMESQVRLLHAADFWREAFNRASAALA